MGDADGTVEVLRQHRLVRAAQVGAVFERLALLLQHLCRLVVRQARKRRL